MPVRQLCSVVEILLVSRIRTLRFDLAFIARALDDYAFDQKVDVFSDLSLGLIDELVDRLHHSLDLIESSEDLLALLCHFFQ